jgi:hypothetical protein
MLEPDLIYLIFRRVHTLETSFFEIGISELSAGGERIYLWSTRYVISAFNDHDRQMQLWVKCSPSAFVDKCPLSPVSTRTGWTFHRCALMMASTAQGIKPYQVRSRVFQFRHEIISCNMSRGASKPRYNCSIPTVFWLASSCGESEWCGDWAWTSLVPWRRGLLREKAQSRRSGARAAKTATWRMWKTWLIYPFTKRSIWPI